MIFKVIVLIASTLLGGISLNFFPSLKSNLRLPLIFAGSYLFAITIIHIIPELFVISDEPSSIGIYILVGFFLQQLLEHLSSGVEHGHFHTDKALSISGRSSIVIALIIHSLLEGTLLVHDSPFHHKHESHSLLLGIVLHKIPAAFALMVTMQHIGRGAYYLLIIFSLATPAGMILSDVLPVSTNGFLILFAIVCGSFLHISTTIFVEASPEHHFGLNKILISLAGAVLAILVEFMSH